GALKAAVRALGRGMLGMAPYLMKTLSVVGTAAMFMVGGSILTHGIPVVHHAIQHAAEATASVAGIGGVLQAVTPTLLDALFGVVAGAAVLLRVTLASKLRGKKKDPAAA